MSLILDALNRSRQETDAVPGLGTQHLVEHPSSGGRNYLPWVALGIAVLLIAWLVLDRDDATQTSDITAPVAELSRNVGSVATAVTTELKSRAAAQRQLQAQQSAQPVDTKSPRQPTVTPSAVVASRQEVAIPTAAPTVPAVENPAVEKNAIDNSAVAKLYQQRSTAQPVPEPPVKAAPVPQQPMPAQQTTEQPIDIEAMVLKARDDLANDDLVEHAAPFVADLSQRTKDGIPTILYQRHDYSDTRSQSSVVLNGKTLRVGGKPAPGMKVDEILPDSVVLSSGGTQFRLRSLNSWVNL